MADGLKNLRRVNNIFCRGDFASRRAPVPYERVGHFATGQSWWVVFSPAQPGFAWRRHG